MNVPYRTMAVYVLYGVCTFFFFFSFCMTDWNATGNWKLGLGTGARWIKYGNELSLFCLLSRATALGINYLLAYYYSVEGSSGSVCFFIDFMLLRCFAFRSPGLARLCLMIT